MRSQPAYFQTPSDITSTDHGLVSFFANGTNDAPDPTGGFLIWRSVGARGVSSADQARTALSPLEAPASAWPAMHKPMSVVKPACESAATVSSAS